VNLFDQRCLEQILPIAQERGMGVIAKRPNANAPWRFAERPAGDYCEEYWMRWKAMAIETKDMDWQELALRFTAHAPAISSAIVGTKSIEHMLQNMKLVDRGPLPAQRFEFLRQTFRQHGDNWEGQI
jgi:aryl-alcohol dehydrogenase-like predicted oxidoreductase